MKGLRKYLTPFAPDQSGAVSVLYELGGLQVIVDAGGCVGNICGFDEPRWFTQRGAVFSAGLRDMDAILGRDDRLVGKLVDAMTRLNVTFAAIIGTPVPAVIGTDYRALKRMAEKKVDVPVLAIDTDGMELYDKGAEKAYLELFRTFAQDTEDRDHGRVGVLGVNPLDSSSPEAGSWVRQILGEQGWRQVDCYGMGCGLDRIRTAGSAEKNIVAAPSGLAAARYLKKRFGTPYEVWDPMASMLLERAEKDRELNWKDKKVLVIAQQVTANSIRNILEERGASVETATWFMQDREITLPGTWALREEDQFQAMVQTGGYDVILGDPDLWPMAADSGAELLDLPHFALSGHRIER